MLKCSWVRKCLDEFSEEKCLGVSKVRDTVVQDAWFTRIFLKFGMFCEVYCSGFVLLPWSCLFVYV